jgi:hypothetical protein
VQNNIEGVLISLSEKLVFLPGTAELQAEAYPVLDTIVKMIEPVENDIRITGHRRLAPVDPRYARQLGAVPGRPRSSPTISSRADSAAHHGCGPGASMTRFSLTIREHRAINSRAGSSWSIGRCRCDQPEHYDFP